jgi:hypothetical protein
MPPEAARAAEAGTSSGATQNSDSLLLPGSSGGGKTDSRRDPFSASHLWHAESVWSWAALLVARARVVELRAFEHHGPAWTGTFDHVPALVRAAHTLNGKGLIYITLNRLARRAINRLIRAKRDGTTHDHEVDRRLWLLVDADPVRDPSTQPTTDAEHAAALAKVVAIASWLIAQGVPASSLMFADSGNGGHLLVAIDEPNDPATRALVQRLLARLAVEFDDAQVKVDQKVFNAGRITKFYGSWVPKGPASPERPHRPSRLVHVPDVLGVVTRETLESLAAPEPRPRAQYRRRASTARFEASVDVAAWIRQHGLPVVGEGPWQTESGTGYRWILSPCPWRPEHTNQAAYVVRLPNGAISAGCHHNGCTGQNWHTLRDLVEGGIRRGTDGLRHREAGIR